jgi:hypothetical protein
MKPTAIARVPEKAVQAQIVHLLRSIGASVYILGTVRPKGDTPGTRQTPGIPDLNVFLPQRTPGNHTETAWIEVKASGGILKPAQVVFQQNCKQAWHHHIVGGMDDVLVFLRAYGWVKAA